VTHCQVLEAVASAAVSDIVASAAVSDIVLSIGWCSVCGYGSVYC
jgi:hypothetical protein